MKVNNMEHIGNYLGIIALIIIGFLAIKKITSCLFKAVVGVILLAIAAYLLANTGLTSSF
ncbi:hypothetical protein [Prevotella disiens]